MVLWNVVIYIGCKKEMIKRKKKNKKMKERDFQHLISLSTVELFENDY
jgi:hypothetical protein